MEIKFLSAVGYNDPDANNGDCIYIDTGSELVIFDCGCEEHAQRIESYMSNHKYRTAKLILSHNDADHFDGIPYLVDRGLVSEVYTLLLLKYVDDIYDRINDRRVTRDSLKRRIKEAFDNIASLSRKVLLRDIFTDTSISSDIAIVGPAKDYALDAVAKLFDGREGDTIDNETIMNAVSTQVNVTVDTKHLLLCGDSSYEAIEDKLDNYTLIQLPHHGKRAQADKIFAQRGSAGITYYVSDNTGSSNGGSDDLPTSGYNIKNTKAGDQLCTSAIAYKAAKPKGSYGWRLVH